jgi:uncharacterized protein (DUF2336 family)
VSSADFRHIAVKGKVHKSERLFRAAVSAFCALTRPARREILQFEELTLQLFGAQSKDSKRFAAAALSDAAEAPNALIHRLCDESVDIAAPLLIRSKTLSDIDLIALIGRHGLPHARAIARRDGLHPTISALIRALEAQQSRTPTETEEPIMLPERRPNRPALELVPLSTPAASVTTPAPQEASGVAAERMRDRLRGFMVPAATIPPPSNTEAGNRERLFARLKMTALTGNPAFFQTALADALDIEFSIARDITSSGGYTSLIAGLKALSLNDERAFLITCAVFPTFFAHAESVRLFVERYQLMHREAALEMVRGWRAETAARQFLRVQPPAAGNSDEKPSAGDHLRAS